LRARAHHRSIDLVNPSPVESVLKLPTRTLARAFSITLIITLGVGLTLLVDIVGAGAATRITEPSSSSLTVPADSAGKPVAITVTATGFTPNESVFIEQCNGKAATDPGWQAALDCDLGSAPAPAIADSEGSVTFLPTDRNHAFTPFAGPSPQLLFNCLAPGAPSPKNAVDDFRNCQVRVSTNNTALTADQQFFTVTLPSGAGTGADDDGGSTFPSVVVLVAGGAVVVALAVFLVRRRRAASAT
jgi:hypothetical protein